MLKDGLSVISLRVTLGDSLWCSSQPTLHDETYDDVTMSAFFTSGIIYEDLCGILRDELLCKYDTEGCIKKDPKIEEAAHYFQYNYFVGFTPLFESYPVRMVAQSIPAFDYQPQWSDGSPDGAKKRFPGGKLILIS